jgi:hypothetical protein
MSEGVGASASDDMLSKRRKDLFGDCALIEIIHLHDCLRGALNALRKDVNELTDHVQLQKKNDCHFDLVADLERRVAGRFKVIWSVFRAHSSAEDEFIWPALQSKTLGRIRGSPPRQEPGEAVSEEQVLQDSPGSIENDTGDELIEQEAYEEDHADEERMFSEMDALLSNLREALVRQKRSDMESGETLAAAIGGIAQDISERTKLLSQHLMTHLDKEEQQCLPLVIKHLSKSEIHDLVGKIMGKRSADTIAQIMTMAVQNLDESDRMEMVKVSLGCELICQLLVIFRCLTFPPNHFST